MDPIERAPAELRDRRCATGPRTYLAAREVAAGAQTSGVNPYCRAAACCAMWSDSKRWDKDRAETQHRFFTFSPLCLDVDFNALWLGLATPVASPQGQPTVASTVVRHTSATYLSLTTYTPSR